jgi:hypothetical protein
VSKFNFRSFCPTSYRLLHGFYVSAYRLFGFRCLYFQKSLVHRVQIFLTLSVAQVLTETTKIWKLFLLLSPGERKLIYGAPIVLYVCTYFCMCIVTCVSSSILLLCLFLSLFFVHTFHSSLVSGLDYGVIEESSCSSLWRKSHNLKTLGCNPRTTITFRSVCSM